MEHQEAMPLKWPDGYGRTLIQDRQSRAAWKKPFTVYQKGVLKELELLGAGAVTITRNPPSEERLDPGVAVWYSRKRTEDFSWQVGLQIDNPKPTIEEISSAFKRLAAKHHPDAVSGGSGGDVRTYMKLDEWRRKARAWVKGENIYGLDNCIPCDVYTDSRQNLAAIKLILSHFRALERLGNPFILERVMERTFRAALPQQGGTDVDKTTAA